VEEKGRERAERSTPPGDFTSDELREQTARFLAELRRRAEKKRREPPKKPGPPPKSL
jgi:predicted Zn-dependent peptidase